MCKRIDPLIKKITVSSREVGITRVKQQGLDTIGKSTKGQKVKGRSHTEQQRIGGV